MKFDITQALVTKDTPQDVVLHKLKHHGAALVEDFFAQDEIAALEQEMDKVWATMDPKDICNIDIGGRTTRKNLYKAGKALLIRPGSYSQFDALVTMFISNKWINDILDAYYGLPNNKFMQTFGYHDTLMRDEEWVDGINHSGAFHFDPFQSLKFGTYLGKTTKQNGATCLVPTSHAEGKYFRENKLQYTLYDGEHVLDCARLFKESKFSQEDAVYLEANPGTLLIFDTDLWHRGSEILEEGLERKLVLCHSRKN